MCDLDGPDRSFGGRDVVDVLLVDDKEPIRTTVAEVLRTSSCSVKVACSAEAALEVLAHHEIGMILLDLRMPGLGGLGLLDAIDVLPPVVTLSAFNLRDDELERVASKVLVQLKKPVNPRRLLDVVAETLEGSSSPLRRLSGR